MNRAERDSLHVCAARRVRRSRSKRPSFGYTLIELLIAAAILAIALAGAAALALATITQEEINMRIARCLNHHEQAARLYQLGLDSAAITALLPVDPAVVSLNFTAANLAIANLGTVEEASSTLVFATTPLSATWTAGTWSSGESSDTARRTNQITVIRPSIR